ncbi:cell division protein ZipA [Dyella sp.]|jgi:cell division protein ZipA|uniref:cell division protein ZipA n=1 Tax=Dyella sp. TaxID=1869338 RepID=UPI002D79902E|nr:cell division protein ZipA [Dyella sp.]HET6433576.1 cell division protein ZipA [Dyella sp.]
MNLDPVLALAWNANVGIPLLIAGIIVLVLIWLFGQPRKEQGRRRASTEPAGTGERREPTVGEASLADDPFFTTLDRDYPQATATPAKPAQGELDMGLREELEKLGATLAGKRGADAPAGSPAPRPSSQAASIIEALRAPSQPEPSVADAPQPVTSTPPPRPTPHSELGKRPPQLPVERIVTLFVVARDGQTFNGPDLIVAAEKAGLDFGDMGIYHRLIDGKRELGPIFSVANMLKPGNFDLGRLETLRTPGLSFFMTLPAPIPALDAWDAMLPTAQRMAELLDGHVLDEERNALGRQRIAHIRDELRGWDRDHEGQEIIFGR